MPANTIAFVRPTYPGERRVALLPQDIAQAKNLTYEKVLIESGFGASMGFTDAAYEAAGCTITTREGCYRSKVVFNLKLIQPDDYPLLQPGTLIIGWMHPGGSGHTFCSTVAREKDLVIFDIDSVYPRLYYPDGSKRDVMGLPPHFFWENSYIAGIAATKLGFDHFGIRSNPQARVCVLGSGSVSQGAFHFLAQHGLYPRMFYRKTLPIFYGTLGQYDIIINGIEVDVDDLNILTAYHLEQTKPDVIIIDAAADAGRAIQGTQYNTLAQPGSTVSGRRYTLVNNAPTLMFNEASRAISKVVGEIILQKPPTL